MNEKYQMNRQLLRWWQQEKGDVSLVYIAGVMMLMLLLAGLAIDGGNAYLQRRQMQTAADAAALAGGSAIAMGKTSTEIAEEINNMLVLNGADPGQSEWYKLDDTKGVNVTARQTFDTYFSEHSTPGAAQPLISLTTV